MRDLHLAGELSKTSIVEVMRSILLSRASGSLLIQRRAARRRFVFFEGELFLPGGHALARHLGQLLESEAASFLGQAPSPTMSSGSREDVTAAARDRLQHIVTRIVDVLLEWGDGEFVFQDQEHQRADFIGPLPTAYLVMEASVRGLGKEQLMEQLGGEQAVVVADTSSSLLSQLQGIDPGEMFIISRAEHPVALQELIRQVPGSRDSVLRMLARLRAVDLLLPYDIQKEKSQVSSDPERILESLVDRFLDRVGNRLRDHPIEIPLAEHKQRVTRLISLLGSFNHYEMLDVELHADEAHIHSAYEDQAALLHPSNAARLGMVGKEPVFRLLFERATAAYLTLNDPERRAEYNQQAGIDGLMEGGGPRIGDEQRGLAREKFLKARDLLGQEELHFALELVRQALRIEPRAEYFALLGDIQSRNPKWIGQATESYRQAIKREPDNADFRVSLGKLLEKAGRANHAKLQYRAALQNAPGEGEAMDGLSRLDEISAAARSEQSFFGRLKGLFGNE
jgi:curved DNA-binding protein CbpA